MVIFWVALALARYWGAFTLRVVMVVFMPSDLGSVAVGTFVGLLAGTLWLLSLNLQVPIVGVLIRQE